jgi:glycosyltransferase involved in cell wall biosynthesis
LKVLFVCREYPPFEVGGVAKHTYYLVKYLEKLGVDCRVLSFGDPEESHEGVTFLKPNSSIISRKDRPIHEDVKIPIDISRLTREAHQILGGGFDLVHVEEPYVGGMVKHTRKVTTIHDTSWGEMRSILNYSFNTPNLKRSIFYLAMGFPMEQLSIANSQKIITPYHHVKEELRRVYRAPEERIQVISNGLEIPDKLSHKDKMMAKEEVGITPEKVLVFTSAQHVARKRLDTLIEAVKILDEIRVNGFQVIIGGDGPLRKNLEKLVMDYDLSHLISLPGWVPEEKLIKYYRAADIFVLSSEYEAGPISLLEAMAYQASIISTKIGGFPSMIQEKVDGLLYPVGDSKTLAIKLKQLSEDPELRMGLTHNAREKVEGFDWMKVAEETKKLYQGLV